MGSLGIRWRGEGGAAELLRVAWPLILGNSFWTIQIALDRILLSRSTAEVGASLAGAVLFWSPLVLFQYTAGYATTFVAQYTGAGQHLRVGPAVWQALHFSLAGGLLGLLALPFAEEIVALGGHSPELATSEAIFFRCLCFAALPTLVTAAVNGFFAGRGATRVVLLIDGLGLFVNILVMCLLVLGLFGLPRLGIFGTGLAVIAGTSTSALLGLALMLRKEHRDENATAAGWRFDPELFGRLMRFGLPNGLFAALEVSAFAAFTFLIGRLGKTELDASSVVLTINLLLYLPPFGIGQAVGVLLGQRLGEGRPDLAEQTTWTGLKIVLYGVALADLVLLLTPDLLIGLFHGPEEASWAEVAELARVLLGFVAAYVLFDGTNMVLSSALRGAGDTRYVTAVTLVLAWPLMVLPTWAAWSWGWGVYWAWGFASAYILLLALAMLVRFRGGKWKTMRVIETPPEETEIPSEPATPAPQTVP